MQGRFLFDGLRFLNLRPSLLVHFVEVKRRDKLLLLLGGIDLGARGLHSDLVILFVHFPDIFDVLLLACSGLIPHGLLIVIFVLEALFLEHFKLSDAVLLTETILSVIAHG